MALRNPLYSFLFKLCAILLIQFSNAAPIVVNSAARPYSVRMADSIILRGQAVLEDQSDPSSPLQVGVFQTALLSLVESPLGRYINQDWEAYIIRSTDSVVGVVDNATEDTQLPLDRLSVGSGLFYLYGKNEVGVYERTLAALRLSIDLQPRNEFGGLWYYVYPYWSYLDGMFSLLSFYPAYTSRFDIDNITNVNDDLFHQLELLWEHCHDNKTGLLFHGYDATKLAPWANPMTGASPIVWGRSLGWFMMGLVDFLELEPDDYLVAKWRTRFLDLASAIVQAVDPASGCWWQVMSAPGRTGNYIESSASAMFIYILYKGVRLGLLQETGYASVAARAYHSLVDRFIVENPDDTISYNGTVGVCSLNSTANYEYYVTQPLEYDSVLGSAAFIRASIEHELRL